MLELSRWQAKCPLTARGVQRFLIASVSEVPFENCSVLTERHLHENFSTTPCCHDTPFVSGLSSLIGIQTVPRDMSGTQHHRDTLCEMCVIDIMTICASSQRVGVPFRLRVDHIYPRVLWHGFVTEKCLMWMKRVAIEVLIRYAM
jgi:hypothetical protein